uniref:histone acetyltransferase n=2 Tax=Caenorhabditis japonica TaxID=281687 RepID=A0A8R1HMU8_CAEJA
MNSPISHTDLEIGTSGHCLLEFNMHTHEHAHFAILSLRLPHSHVSYLLTHTLFVSDADTNDDDSDYSVSSVSRPVRRRQTGGGPRKVQAVRDKMPSTAKRRNTVNSRCASIPLHPNQLLRPPPVADRCDQLDSDAEDVNDDEMASSSSFSELSKRPRTPKPRYSPDGRRHTPRFSNLQIDTSHRTSDLNADGSGPSSSGAQSNHAPESEKRESRRKPFQIQEDVRKRASTISSASRPRKKRSPSPLDSQGENTAADSDECAEWENLPIVRDDPSFVLTEEHKTRFKNIKSRVKERVMMNPTKVSEVFRNSGAENARLPRSIQMGGYLMQTWYGSPFPAEYINVECLLICEFCMFYARSDPVMQNHAKKCTMRAPPGKEIYRKDYISVFEVDGKAERSYCQHVCLISRLFLESKTVFYDTEPFLFYIVTVNDEMGCHFAGYFSKEKYEPDRNNLSCIMTLPCYQDKGFGRFLIDISYALSRREKWLGGPEQPLSDLGRIAYGSYFRGVIFKFLKKNYENIELADNLSVLDISEATGIHPNDVIEFLDSFGYILLTTADEHGIFEMEWNVDWEHVDWYLEKRAKEDKGRVVFDENCLSWKPRRITPAMDGFCEPSQEDIEADEERKRQLQRTPITESMQNTTPVSVMSMPCGSVKKGLKSRGVRSTASRNLKNELSKKVTVPEWADARVVTDDDDDEEGDESKHRDERKRRRRGRKGATRCAEAVIEKDTPREDSPEDEGSSKPTGRRPRGSRTNDEPPVEQQKNGAPGPEKGKGRHHRNRKGMYEDSEDRTGSESSEEEDTAYGATGSKGKKGKKGPQRRKGSQKHVAGKQFPPNFGSRDEKPKEEEPEKMKTSDSEPDGDGKEENAPGSSGVEICKEDEEEASKAEPEKQEEAPKSDPDEEMQLDYFEENDDDVAVEGYTIRTPESYHSASASPAPAPPPLAEQPQVFIEENHSQFEENDIAPPLLVSEVGNLSVNEPVAETNDESDAAPPALAAPTLDGYSTEDDDAPPRLSPQFGKNEDNEEEEEEVEKTVKTPEMMMNGERNGHQQHQPQEPPFQMAAGPSTSMHMTPMMTSTPQHPYSQPNSHQQATPGSGGTPSCGVPPAYNHSTPEQQQQQFMSPQMSGMPASVSSVHSVHNNNSMEMVGGSASLQHTPQQQPPPPYDMGHAMGQRPQDNGVMNNSSVVANIEQQNQMMMQHHGFNSPPAQNNVVLPPTQPQQPTQVAPMVPTAAPTNGRRRSGTENSAARKPRQTQQQRAAAAAAAAATNQINPMAVNMPMNQMQMQFPYYSPYGYAPVWDPNFYYNNYYVPNPPNPHFPPQLAAWPQQQQPQNGQMPGVEAATAAVQFPPSSTAGWYPNYNMR